MNKKLNQIDFVILWVDSNDEAWQKKRNFYLQKENKAQLDVSPNRYRDWDNLKYWFRGVSKFAPWVRKIHFVTDGQIPLWLDLNNEKIHIVNHSDFISNDFLPLFNSSAIEVGMQNIKELSNCFVYFNDDMFLIQPVEPEYYFKDGLPIDMAGITSPTSSKTQIGKIWENNYCVLNQHFKKSEVILKNLSKWMNPFYGKTFFRTLLNIDRPTFDGLVVPHLSVPYLKSDFEKVWELEGKKLLNTQSHKFRADSDITHFLFRYWRMLEGNFKPKRSKGKYFSAIDETSIYNISNAIKKQKYTEICINDCWEGQDFENAKEEIKKAFDIILPNKCEFEK